MNPTPPSGKVRRGCMFYGCIIGVVFMLMLLAGGFVGLRYAKRMITVFTESKPMELPASRLSADETQRLQERVNAFRLAVNTGKPVEPLVLTSDEINALIANDPQLNSLRGKLYVTLDGDRVKAQISIPMEQTRLRVFRQRYLNGDATVSVAFQKGHLQIHLDAINVKGKPLPSVYMQALREQDWAQMAQTNNNSAAALDKLQSIDVKDSKLIITPAVPVPAPAP